MVVAIYFPEMRRAGVTTTCEFRRRTLPLALRWQHPAKPLPIRTVHQPPQSPIRTVGLEAPPWHKSGPDDRPFDFCGAIGRLCADIAKRCPELAHIDVPRLLIGMTQARGGQRHGLQARVTPLRCRDGHLIRRHDDIDYRVQRYFVDGREMLYLLTFCLPRFLDQDFDDKFITLFHELYHISPAFEGDLRRLGGRCALHSPRKRDYDIRMAGLARAYLSGGADPALHSCLRMDFAQLKHRHGSVQGVIVPRPRLLPIPEED